MSLFAQPTDQLVGVGIAEAGPFTVFVGAWIGVAIGAFQCLGAHFMPSQEFFFTVTIVTNVTRGMWLVTNVTFVDTALSKTFDSILILDCNICNICNTVFENI
jgi:hypothetical protein